MDVQKEREAFEAYMAENYKNLMDRRQCLNNGGGYMAWDMNVAWKVWQAAKAHEAEKLKGCVVVPESELKDTFYWPDSEYVVDCPFDYDFELDKGEIQAIEKWKQTKSTKIYFANIYKDDESFEITEFKSLEEAQDAVKENNAYLEAQEFFNLAEAARGGNE